MNKYITYHSESTGKRREPISTCPAPVNIQYYGFLPLLFLLLISFFFLVIFNKSAAPKEQKMAKIFYFIRSLSSCQSRRRSRREGSGSFLIVSCAEEAQIFGHPQLCASSPPRVAPGLSAAASLCRSRALMRETDSQRRSPGNQSATSAVPAESEAGDAEDERAQRSN